MSDATDRIVAIKAVMDRVQLDAAPTLTQGEIELEVDRAKLASIWAIDTAYNIGDVVVPTIRNGHAYECTRPGTSGSAVLAFLDWPTATGAIISDGTSSPVLMWEEVGTDLFNPGIFKAERNVYDINRAARECWLLKARKVSPLIDSGDTSFSHLYKHCLEQAERFRPFARQIQLVRA